jgi:hypothetical protein
MFAKTKKSQTASTKLFTRLNNSIIYVTTLVMKITVLTLPQNHRRQFNWAGKYQISISNDQNSHDSYIASPTLIRRQRCLWAQQ